MTSPARGGPDTAGMRSELAEALLAATTDYGTGKASPEVDLFDFYADALLPVVQRLAVEKAAEELRAAADDVQRRCVLNKHEAASVLRDRAAALAAAAQPTDGRTGA